MPQRLSAYGWSQRGLSVIAALLGYVGLTYYLNERPEYAGAEPFDRVYYTLQLLMLSPTPLGGPPYGPMLSIAMYLAPLTTVLAVLQAVSAVFRARFAAWVLLRKRGHSIVVGAGPAAFVLARRLAATRPTVLVGSRIGSDVASRDAVRVVDGDPTDEATLRAAGVRGAARVFALGNSGAVNASVALLVRSLNQAGVAVYARADEGDLVAALRARRLGVDRHNGYRLNFFSIEDVAAVALLDVHDRDLERTAVVVGSDRFTHAVERDLIRRRRRAGTPVAGRVVRIDDEASAARSAGTVYVSAGDANDALRRGLRLLLAGNDRVVLCLGSAPARRSTAIRISTRRMRPSKCVSSPRCRECRRRTRRHRCSRWPRTSAFVPWRSRHSTPDPTSAVRMARNPSPSLPSTKPRPAALPEIVTDVSP